MSQTLALKDIVLRDTPFADLMTKRIYNVLLIATKYDAFMLEEDGRVDEEIFNEYTHLGLRYPPRFTQVTTEEEALAELADRHFELIIMMPNMDKRDLFSMAKEIKAFRPSVPIVVLTPFNREVSKRVADEDLTYIDFIFSWLGESDLLVAIIKLMEDLWNAPQDCPAVGVQVIILVEDSIRFYSAALPHLFRYVLVQSQEFAKEALNDQLRTMRMRGRPKIMLARNYEEAVELYETYKDNVLGVISDMSFMRHGEKDALAGYHLGQYLKAQDHHLPLILQSSEEENAKYAQLLDCPFIPKKAKDFPQQLRQRVMESFGFGDFIIIDPATGKEIKRISSLRDLQYGLADIPDDAMRYHLERNHFSRFFFSRAMFPPAMILKHIEVTEGTDMNESRELIYNLILSYRKVKNQGVVAIYNRNMFDQYSHFARIGKGSLGGKGRGLAFMSTIATRYPNIGTENFSVRIPRTVVICTDVFDEFMERNVLYPIALSDSSDEEILDAFQRATLPTVVREDLENLLGSIKKPIAVRSSSMLEDAHYQPFAGVYSTYMVPLHPTTDEMLTAVCSAIKGVYASVFFHDSKTYLTATQNLIDQEKMAIVLQEVVGTAHGNMFYPMLSGVARSLNFYPVGEEKTEDGIANIALGLGKHIVDGGVTLRFSPQHPENILQLGTTKTALRETQKTFAALDLTKTKATIAPDETYNLCTLPIAEVKDKRLLRYVASTYNMEDDYLMEGFHERGRKIVSFANTLSSVQFPLPKTIDALLNVGATEMGRPVEIEFAMDLDAQDTNVAHFYLLQIRPIVDNKEYITEDLHALSTDNLLLSSQRMLGNGLVTDVCDIIYVKSEGYDAANNQQIATEIEALNRQMQAEGRLYILIGSGRWGSSDPWLGVPVKWAHISEARIIVERGLESYQVDPSQGTHFFQNLTSFGIGYFTINPFRGDGFFDEAYLNALPAEYESQHLRHIRHATPFVIKMDGRSGIGVVEKPL